MARVSFGFTKEEKAMSEEMKNNNFSLHSTYRSLAAKRGITKETVNKRINHPGTMTVTDLRFFCKELKVPPILLINLIYGEENAKKILNSTNSNHIMDASVRS